MFDSLKNIGKISLKQLLREIHANVPLTGIRLWPLDVKGT